MRYASRPEFWFCALATWTLLSALRSVSTPWSALALSEWIRWAAGIGIALTLGHCLRRTRMLARTGTCAAGVLALCGLARGLNGHWGMTGPFHDHQLFGSAILLGLPVTLAVGLTARSAWWRTLARVTFFVLLMELILAQSRSAWAGASAGLLVFISLWIRMSAGQGIRQLWSLILLASGVMVAFIIILCATEMQKPVALRLATLTTLSNDTGWQARTQTWRGTRAMIAASPMLGTGLGRYPDRQRAFTQTGRVLTPQMRPSLSEQAHSAYLQTAAEIGCPGLALSILGMLMLAGRCLYCLRRAWGQTPSARESLLIATLALQASQAVDAFASPSWQFGEITLPFWCLLGLGMAVVARPDTPEPLTVSLRKRPARYVVAAACALCAVLSALLLAPLSPVAAYSAVNRLYLTSVTVAPSCHVIHCHGIIQTITFRAAAHYRWTQSNTPGPDQDLTFDGPPDGVSGTVFTVRSSTDTVRSGFYALDPGTRNVLSIAPISSTKTPQILTITAICAVPDGDNRPTVTSAPVTVVCVP